MVVLAGALAPIRRALPGAMTRAAEAPTDADAVRMVDALLNAGLDANTLGVGEEDSALRLAVKGHRWATATRLLQAGGCPDGPPVDRRSSRPPVDRRSARIESLYDVAAHGPLTLLQAFLQANEHWGRQEPWGDDRSTRTAFLVMEHWLDADTTTGLNTQVRESRHQRSLLVLAVVLRDANLVGRLLDERYPVVGSSYESLGEAENRPSGPNTENVWMTLAHLAVKANHGPVVERLLAQGIPFESDSDRPASMGDGALGTPLAFARQLQATEALVAIERHILRRAMGAAAEASEPTTAPPRARL